MDIHIDKKIAGLMIFALIVGGVLGGVVGFVAGHEEGGHGGRDGYEMGRDQMDNQGIEPNQDQQNANGAPAASASTVPAIPVQVGE